MPQQQQQAKPKDSTSTEFIRQRLAQQQAKIAQKQAQLAQQNAILDDADAYIDKKTADKPDIQSQKDLHKRAEDADAASEDGDQGTITTAEAEIEESDEEQSAFDKARAIGQAAADAITPLTDKIASTPVPSSGIALLLVILTVLLFTVVVVNKSGDTRLKQIWYMLNGQATIIGRKLVPSQQQGGSASGTFSTTGTTTGTNTTPVVVASSIVPASTSGVVTLDTVPSHGVTTEF